MNIPSKSPVQPLSPEDLRQIGGGASDSEWRYVSVRRYPA